MPPPVLPFSAIAQEVVSCEGFVESIYKIIGDVNHERYGADSLLRALEMSHAACNFDRQVWLTLARAYGLERLERYGEAFEITRRLVRATRAMDAVNAARTYNLHALLLEHHEDYTAALYYLHRAQKIDTTTDPDVQANYAAKIGHLLAHTGRLEDGFCHVVAARDSLTGRSGVVARRIYRRTIAHTLTDHVADSLGYLDEGRCDSLAYSPERPPDERTGEVARIYIGLIVVIVGSLCALVWGIYLTRRQPARLHPPAHSPTWRRATTGED